ncbi:MAG: glycoside hydrolase N-terminal domain-containing protein [Verrucomicrobiota bacterium]
MKIQSILTLTAAIFLALPAQAGPITIHSEKPSRNWEEAMIGGNGNQGIMVLGRTHDETIVINHTKCWVPAQPVKPYIPDISIETARSRELAKEGKYVEAASLAFEAFGMANARTFPREALFRNGPRFGLNYVHPAAHLRISQDKHGEVTNYRRALTFDSGEIVTSWTDDAGDWSRSAFVSRPDDVTVVRLSRTKSTPWSGTIRLAESPGYNTKDIAAPTITHRDKGMHLKTYYKHLHWLEEADGYETGIQVVTKGGTTETSDEGIKVSGADEVLVFLRTDYLPVYSKSDEDAFHADLKGKAGGFEPILERHAKVHGDIFRRVSFDLGGKFGDRRSTEAILAEAKEKGPTPAYLELIHASGRYLLISSSGDIPPTLMGIWGDTWEPDWWGHYTLDSNLQLAVSNGNVGNLPEAMESLFGWIETLYPNWEHNAKQLYGAKGYVGAIAHGWRHGLALAGWNEWTGCASWMATYFWDHYLITGDKEFLAKRVVPLLEQIEIFYRDFLTGSEGKDGRFFIYPSTSPENFPSNFKGHRTAPNATSEIALIKQTFQSLAESYRILGIKEDRIPSLEAFVAKLPEYRINDDGALAEWAHPDVAENYNHRHNSHLIALYPGVSINPSTPKLYEAAKVAIDMRRKAGQGNKSAHGYMELGFAGARLQNPDIVWTMLNDYATQDFLHPSFVSSHNPDRHIYNLDSIFALPAVFTEMCLYSRPGTINLLPGLPEDKLPKGSIRGALARKAMVIDELSWDLEKGTAILKLTSKQDQQVELTSRLGITGVKGANQSDGKWIIDLKANEPEEYLVSFGKPDR